MPTEKIIAARPMNSSLSEDNRTIECSNLTYGYHRDDRHFHLNAENVGSAVFAEW